MEIDRNGFEVLPREECLRLLSKATIGRLALSCRALPTVIPVTFSVQDDRIYVRTGTGPQLTDALRDAVVAFEVDDIDPIDHTGWNVVVTGRANEVTDFAELDLVTLSPTTAWAQTGNGRVAAIDIELVSGRRYTGTHFR
jgi:nitroimidazol reductase NimA-like FMN-containing flavoprotein (pyridoxamine 5'-phosphate oxidase superfamily)